jgi:hypothetical protein
MEHFLVAVIVIAALFAIISIFVPIDGRIQRIIWIVLAALVGIWAVRFLVPMLGL